MDIKKIAKHIAIIFIIGGLFFSVSLSFAKDTNSYGTSINFSAKRQELMNAVEQRVKKAQEDLQLFREKAQELVKDKVEKAKKKIEDIRDQGKKQMAEQISNQFDHVNKVWTDHFMNQLDRYDAILQKIQIRSDKAAANGKNVVVVNTAIQSATTAIATARTAVTTQAQKTYTLNATTISIGVTATSTDDDQAHLIKNFRDQFKALHEQLKQDLFALRDGQMKDARVAVQNAAKALSQIPGVDEEPSHSTSTTSTSTNE